MQHRSAYHSDDASPHARARRNSLRGGSASVSPDDTIGAWDLCWCGKPSGHDDWPGASDGAPHPREGS